LLKLDDVFPVFPPINLLVIKMTTRTTKKTVTFTNSFSLNELDKPLPAGSYNVEIEEELLESLSFQAYRRVQTLLYLPAISNNQSNTSRIIVIDANGLDAAMKQDHALDSSH